MAHPFVATMIDGGLEGCGPSQPWPAVNQHHFTAPTERTPSRESASNGPSVRGNDVRWRPGGLRSLAAVAGRKLNTGFTAPTERTPSRGAASNGPPSLPRRQSKKLVRSDFNERKANILLLFRLIEFDLPTVIFPSFQDIKVPNLCRFVRLQEIRLSLPAQHFPARFFPWIGTQGDGVRNRGRLGDPFITLAVRLIQPGAPDDKTQQRKKAGHESDRPVSTRKLLAGIDVHRTKYRILEKAKRLMRGYGKNLTHL